MENIVCTIEKSNPLDKSKLQSKFIRLSEIGLDIAHTVTTHEPNIYVQHSNMVIDIRKVDLMNDENTMLKSRAEQSRAEQSRAEQSRAEQLKVCSIGNIYKDNWGTGFPGNVWDKNQLSPTLSTMQGGGREPMILEVNKMETNILGNIEESNKHQSGNVYDSSGTSPNIMAGTHGYGMGYVIDDKKICAMRGRDKDNPSDRTVGNKNLEQRLEVNKNGTSNTITSVQKDNFVLESSVLGGMEENSNQRYKVYEKNKLCPTLQAACGTGGGNIPYITEEIHFTSNGCVDCDSCNHRSEDCLCDISNNDEECPLIPKIKIRQATKDGFVECELPGIADLNYTSSKTRRGRVVEGGANKSYFNNGEYP